MEHESRTDLEQGPNALANGTGGELFADNNDLAALGRSALARNDVYYELGYYAQEPGAGFREITVRVKNHPEYTVRAQTGYGPIEAGARAEAAGAASDRLAQALARPLPASNLGVTVEVESIRRDRGDTSVTLRSHVEGSRLSYDAAGGHRAVALDAAGVVYDLHGTPVFSWHDRVGGDLEPEGVELARKRGFRYTAHVDALKPGIYQARVGFLEPATGRIGTAAIWVEVPK
jgi:hypothetical protein